MQHMEMYRIAMQTDGALAIHELVLHVSYPEWVNSTTHPLGEILVCSILCLDTMDGGMYTIALHSTIRIPSFYRTVGHYVAMQHMERWRNPYS